MAYRATLLFILVILVADVVANWGRNRRTCRGICKGKKGEVIATKRPRSNGKCVAFVCRKCRLKRRRISDCWSTYHDLVIKGKDKAKCKYGGKTIHDGIAIEVTGGILICLNGKFTSASLASNFGAFG